MEDVRREAKLAFALSIQSIWERQLRAYLTGCARELRPGEADWTKRIARATWAELRKLFSRLRGIALEAFPSFSGLDTLHLLGNAGRHGDGDAGEALYRRCRDLWSLTPVLVEEHFPALSGPLPVALMDVPAERLREFVSVIADFWRDVEYIYHESLEPGDDNVGRWLARARETRAWMPQATESDAG